MIPILTINQDPFVMSFVVAFSESRIEGIMASDHSILPGLSQNLFMIYGRVKRKSQKEKEIFFSNG